MHKLKENLSGLEPLAFEWEKGDQPQTQTLAAPEFSGWWNLEYVINTAYCSTVFVTLLHGDGCSSKISIKEFGDLEGVMSENISMILFQDLKPAIAKSKNYQCSFWKHKKTGPWARAQLPFPLLLKSLLLLYKSPHDEGAFWIYGTGVWKSLHLCFILLSGEACAQAHQPQNNQILPYIWPITAIKEGLPACSAVSPFKSEQDK